MAKENNASGELLFSDLATIGSRLFLANFRRLLLVICHGSGQPLDGERAREREDPRPQPGGVDVTSHCLLS